MTNRVSKLLASSITVALCSLLFISCITWDNHGFPSTVSFSAEGGRQVFKGDGEYFIGFSIQNSKGDSYAWTSIVDELDSMVVSYDWLTIKTKTFSSEVEFIAAPNTGKKNRSLYIEGYFGKDNASVKVKQKH